MNDLSTTCGKTAQRWGLDLIMVKLQELADRTEDDAVALRCLDLLLTEAKAPVGQVEQVAPAIKAHRAYEAARKDRDRELVPAWQEKKPEQDDGA